MPWLLERELTKLGHRSDPDRAFVRALQKTLKMQTGHPAWWVQSWKYAVVGSTVVALACSATGVYAYTSDDVLPGDPLYTVRQGIENVEVAAAVTPTLKADVQVKLLARRLHEQELVAARQKPIAPAKLKVLDSTVEKDLDAAALAPTSTQQKVDAAVVKLEKLHSQELLKQQAEAKTPQQKSKIEGMLQTQRDDVQKMINSLPANRKAQYG
ncbi:MAG: DUF5667 domain-containing protein, partial [Patescibacteria group bacterium]